MTDYSELIRRLELARDSRSTTRIDAELFGEALGAIESLKTSLARANRVIEAASKLERDRWASASRAGLRGVRWEPPRDA